jgi:hypothetical protein
VTPEQRAFVVGEIESMAEAYVLEDGCVDCASCAAMQAALLVLTEEAERDQRLGAAVRAAIPGASADDYEAWAEWKRRETGGGDLFRAIARALRAEASK